MGTYFDASGGEHGFTYNAVEGTREILGLGGSETVAEGINDLGEVVGGTTLPDGSEFAYLYTGAEGMIDLDPLAQVNGYTLVDAIGINDGGQIVAAGLDAHGNPNAFLLTPTPEPSTLALLASLAIVVKVSSYRGRRRAERDAGRPRGRRVLQSRSR